MTLTHAEQQLAPVSLPESLLSYAATYAHDIDIGHQTTRQVLSDIATVGLADLGAVPNHATLLEQAAVIEALAEQSFSTAFSLWCHRMCIEYLSIAGGEHADRLRTKLSAGELVGSSAMAPGFKYVAGLGDLSLHIQRDTTGQLRLSGQLAWASNLFDDAVIFAAAHGPTETSAPVVVAFPVSATGVEVGPELDLLSLRGTASTSVTLQEVSLDEDQLLTTDISSFLGRARPVLSLLQASFCLGLATESHRHIRTRLAGVHQVLHGEFQPLSNRLVQVKQRFVELALKVGSSHPPDPKQVLATRLEAGVLAKELTRLEVIAAGSQGFVTTSDANRRYREGTFVPLQAPSEAQLRWELGQAGDHT